MLNVVVHPSVKKGRFGFGNFRNMKIAEPNMASGTEPPRMTSGSRKLLNCAARTRKMSATASPIVVQNFALPPSRRSWRDSPGVVDVVALGQDLGALVLEELEGVVERHAGRRR